LIVVAGERRHDGGNRRCRGAGYVPGPFLRMLLRPSTLFFAMAVGCSSFAFVAMLAQ
jgi:hypothetical protein